MLDEALRQINHTFLKEQEEILAKKCHENEGMPKVKSKSEGNMKKREEDQRQCWSPRSSTEKSSGGSGYHTPPYLSPGTTRKLAKNLKLQTHLYDKT